MVSTNAKGAYDNDALIEMAEELLERRNATWVLDNEPAVLVLAQRRHSEIFYNLELCTIDVLLPLAQ